jgi:hypothetical protein
MLTKRGVKLAENSTGELGKPDNHIARAYSRLQDTVKNSIQVPSDVVAAITAAKQSVAATGNFANEEQETRFWNAYGLLSSIGPADIAREKYKKSFYIVLIALLILQLLYLAGNLIDKRLRTVEEEWQRTADTRQAGAPLNNSLPTGTDWARLRRAATIEANYEFASALLHPWNLFRTDGSLAIRLNEMRERHHVFSLEQIKYVVGYMKIKGELELFLAAMLSYILPLLYGLLGAFAFVLRKLSDPVGKLTYAHDTRTSYTLRLHIGALSGLAIGWFINGNTSEAGVASLPPLALAFAAGYASDLLFTALDKVVGAFSPVISTQASVHTETTVGGMTMTTEVQRDARVAGSAVSAPIEPTASGGDKRAETQSTDQTRPKAA